MVASQVTYASSVCHMFCSSAQHPRREKRSGTFLSQKRHANRVRLCLYNQRKRKRLTLIVILSALLSCAPERSVWTLSRNDWLAMNAGDTIDIGAWPDAMFVSNPRMSKTTFVTRLRSRLATNPRVHSTGGRFACGGASV